MRLPVLGIDVSKRTFHAALFQEGKFRQKAFPNTTDGFEQLKAWLGKQSVEGLHACMESTGAYGEALALFLFELGHVVSVVNPARIKGFAQSELSRTKTDPVDAGIIARFCLALNPKPWQPPSPDVRGLKAWVHRLWDLQEMRQMELNRLEAGNIPEPVAESLKALIGYLDGELKQVRREIRAYVKRHLRLKRQFDLLVSIPGIGELTAAAILGEVEDVTAFQSARHLASFAGLTPREKQSGTSVKGRARLSKIGNARLRKALYLPAVVAQKCNPIVREFSLRLKSHGKTKMAVVGASMRKLLHIVYGVLKSGRPFDPSLAVS